MCTLHTTYYLRLHNSKDTITSNEDDYHDASLPAYTYKKGDYEHYKDARVASLAHLLKPRQDVANELYVCNIYFVSNEQSRTQI